MKEVLQNLALINCIDYCKKNNIDCSGTYIYKYPRRFTYALIKNGTSKTIITVSFYKDKVPCFFNHTNK